MANFGTVSLFITLAATIASCFLFSPAFLSIGAAQIPELATEICKKSTDFAFCRAAVYSDPRAFTADREELIDIVLRKAYANATDTKDYIAAKIESGGGNDLQTCLGDYDEAIQTLTEMLNDLNSDSYYKLDVRTLAVEGRVRDCKTGLRESIVVQRNQNMLKLANICYVVSKLFN